MQEFTAKWFNKSIPEPVPNENRTIWRSRGDLYALTLATMQPEPVWIYVPVWSDFYKRTFVCPFHNAVLSYCEGDWILSVSGDRQTFTKDLKGCKQFHKSGG